MRMFATAVLALLLAALPGASSAALPIGFRAAGKIVMAHLDVDWSEHVANTLAAVKALKK